MNSSLLALFVLLVCALTSNITSKTLVVLDNKNLRDTHSQFFTQLEQFGHITYAYSFSPKEIALKYYDEYIYDQLVVFCTSEQDQESALKVQSIIEFFDSGRDVLVAGDLDISRGYRKLFYAFGVEPDQTGIEVKDNFNNHQGNSTTVVSSFIEDAYPFVSDKLPNGRVAYRGLGLKLVNYVNNQLFAIVRGQPTTYAKNHKDGNAVRAGSDIALVATVQGLNNARALLTGSLDFFSDEFLDLSEYDNSVLVSNLLRWTFKKSGVIRVGRVKHYSVGQRQTETLFTVTERIHYEAQVEEYDYNTNTWVPYIASDMNVEFVMLDPWVINKLENQRGSSLYVAEFDSPTKEGIYQFKLIYEKPGFNFVADKSRVTLRTKKHDQFERFIFTATPYYAATFATIGGSFLFIVFYLYTAHKTKKQ